MWSGDYSAWGASSEHGGHFHKAARALPTPFSLLLGQDFRAHPLLFCIQARSAAALGAAPLFSHGTEGAAMLAPQPLACLPPCGGFCSQLHEVPTAAGSPSARPRCSGSCLPAQEITQHWWQKPEHGGLASQRTAVMGGCEGLPRWHWGRSLCWARLRGASR